MKEIGFLHHHVAGICVLVSDSGIALQFLWNFMWTLFNLGTPLLFSFYFPTIGNNNMANAQTFEAGTPRTSGPNDVWQLTLQFFFKIIFL